MILLLYLLPQFWELMGVWYASLVTAGLLSLLAVVLLRLERKTL